MDLTDTYRTFHPTTEGICFLLQGTWNILQDSPHGRLQHNLNKFKRIEIISSIVSNNNGMKVEVSSRSNS
jgi:hypothetical protein